MVYILNIKRFLGLLEIAFTINIRVELTKEGELLVAEIHYSNQILFVEYDDDKLHLLLDQHRLLPQQITEE